MLRLLLAIALALLSGCSSPKLSPLTVTVTNAATSSPVAGAKVLAEVPSMNHPFSVATIFGETKELTSSDFTDQSGRAAVSFADGRSVRITVLAPGYSVLTQLIQEPWSGEVDAENLVESSAGLSAFHIRVTPAGGAKPTVAVR